MFLIELDYPSEAEEIQIARTTTGEALPRARPPPDAAARLSGIRVWSAGYRSPTIFIAYAARLVRKTRPSDASSPAWLKPLVSWGAGPRAVQYLILGAKARAALLGSYMVRLEDIQEVAAPVLTHRIITTFAAQAEGIDAKTIVRRLDRGDRQRRRRADDHVLRFISGKATDPMFPDRQPRSFLDHRSLSRLAGFPLLRAAADAGNDVGPASQPASRVERRVCRVSQVCPRRRPAAARLAGLWAIGPLLRQGVRGRHEPPLLPRARHQRVDGLSARAASPRSSTPAGSPAPSGYLAAPARRRGRAVLRRRGHRAATFRRGAIRPT